MANSNSTKAVVSALLANGSIGVIKFIAYLFTQSSSMLAESVHSFADTMNQVFLLIGTKRSQKGSDETHSFGYGREEYFWGMMVAILLFFLGSIYSIYEGIHKILDPKPLENVVWLFVVFGLAIVLEGRVFIMAYKALRKENPETSINTAIKNSTDTNLVIVFLEDFGALVGLVVAMICTAIAVYFPIFDGIGSLLVGILLSYVSYTLINEIRKLIVGESLTREVRNEIKDIVKSFQIVDHVNRIKSMAIGNNKYLLIISVNVDDYAKGFAVEDLTENIKNDVLAKYPFITEIYVDISDK